jgi:hypothetical protein
MVKTLILLTVVTLVFGACAEAEFLSVSVSASQSFTVWQTSPPVFESSTTWGGVGIALIYSRLSLSGAITLLDIESMRVRFPPAFSMSLNLNWMEIEPFGLSIGVGFVLNPSNNVGAYIGISFSWSPFHFNTYNVGVGIQTILPGSSLSATGIYIGCGVSIIIPLL